MQFLFIHEASIQYPFQGAPALVGYINIKVNKIIATKWTGNWTS